MARKVSVVGGLPGPLFFRPVLREWESFFAGGDKTISYQQE
jgi:hypothetical protein